MELNSIVHPECILTGVKPSSKKQVLQEMAELAASHTGRGVQEILEVLLEREKLGSTGVGNGVAIPHGKLPKLEGISGYFARLTKPVNFDSVDDQPVDVVFMLLAPEGSGADHLKALSRIARVLRNQSTLASLRGAKDVDSIFSLITDEHSANAA